jgi:hypothetical protein
MDDGARAQARDVHENEAEDGSAVSTQERRRLWQLLYPRCMLRKNKRDSTTPPFAPHWVKCEKKSR